MLEVLVQDWYITILAVYMYHRGDFEVFVSNWFDEATRHHVKLYHTIMLAKADLLFHHGSVHEEL